MGSVTSDIQDPGKSPGDRQLIRAGRLFTGGGAAPLADRMIEITDGVVTGIAPAGEAGGQADAHFDIIAPGFIDLQINGAGGALFNDAPNEATLRTMISAARKGGTCHMLPTFITAAGDAYRQAMAAVAAFSGPEVLGLHLEGPFLSPDKPGIHPKDAIRTIADDDIGALVSHRGLILLTLAPELVTAEQMALLRKAGIVLFAGHTNATAETVSAAAGQGLAGVTHLFNACSQMQAREPGVVGAALADPRLSAGIIADGVHVHANALRVASRAMAGRLFLVTDSMPTFGGPADSFMLGGQEIIRVGNRLQSGSGTLAGAHLGLNEAVANMVELADVPLAHALHMASGVPAAVLGLDQIYGGIAEGRPASLTCLAADLTPQAVFVHGYWSAACQPAVVSRPDGNRW